MPGSKSLGPIARSVRSAQSSVTSGRDKIIAAFMPGKREAGLAALAKLDQGLLEFQALIDAKDKQVEGVGAAVCVAAPGAKAPQWPLQLPAWIQQVPGELVGVCSQCGHPCSPVFHAGRAWCALAHAHVMPHTHPGPHTRRLCPSSSASAWSTWARWRRPWCRASALMFPQSMQTARCSRCDGSADMERQR